MHHACTSVDEFDAHAWCGDGWLTNTTTAQPREQAPTAVTSHRALPEEAVRAPVLGKLGRAITQDGLADVAAAEAPRHPTAKKRSERNVVVIWA